MARVGSKEYKKKMLKKQVKKGEKNIEMLKESYLLGYKSPKGTSAIQGIVKTTQDNKRKKKKLKKLKTKY